MKGKTMADMKIGVKAGNVMYVLKPDRTWDSGDADLDAEANEIAGAVEPRSWEGDPVCFQIRKLANEIGGIPILPPPSQWQSEEISPV